MVQENGDYVSLNDGFLNGYEDKIYENKGEHPYSYTVKKVIFKNGKVVSNSGKTDESITKEDGKTKIKLETTKGNIPDNTTMDITEITSGETFDKIKNNLVEIKNFKAFNITLKVNDKIIQPNGKVKISIPVLEDADSSKLVVYRLDDDETKTEIQVNITNGYAVFETEHFSTYILAEKTEVFNGSQDSTEKNNDDKLPQTGEEANPFANYLTIVIILGIIWLGSMILIDQEKKKMTKK